MEGKRYGHGMRCNGKWAGLLLVLWAALVSGAEPPSFKLPGRKSDSKEPWGTYLGRTAHMVIGEQYVMRHSYIGVFLDPATLFQIVEEGGLGNSKRLSPFARGLRPDITNTRERVLFEIKPDHEQGRGQGREQAESYLAALNMVVEPDKKFSGGTGFEGSLLLEFEDGGALWRLSWRTPEPGVTLYRWGYRRKQPNASWQERMAQEEIALPQEEVERRGAVAEQALRAAYKKGAWPSDFHGQVYLPVDCH